MSSEDEEGRPGGFLARWSRLKRRAQAEPDADDATPGEGGPQAEAVPEEPGDLSALPPIDELTAGSDFSAFMKAGVPQNLRRAALRKLWVTDPDFAAYKTLADYDWDFNAPGYGQMLPSDDAKRYMEQVLGRIARETDAGQGAPADGASAGEPYLAQQVDSEVRTIPEGPAVSAEGPAGHLPTSSRPEAGAEISPPAPAAAATAVPAPAPVLEPARRRRHGGAAPS